MSTKNERSLALMVRALIAKSDLRLSDDDKALFLDTCREIIAEGDDGTRKPREDDTYRYEGIECRSFVKNEKEYAKGQDGAGGDDDAAVCNAKRLGMYGNVVMLTAWKKDEDGNEICALDIYYDYTLTYILQPVTDKTGKLLGFARMDNSPLCGQSRLRNNLKTWADKGMDQFAIDHNFESDPEYLAVSPRYRYDLSKPNERELWQALCDKFYKVHPRIKIDNADPDVESESVE